MSRWRERYEQLRRDHESTVRKLADVEAADQATRFSGSRFAPQRVGYSQSHADYQSVAEAVVSPLLRLRDEYLGAVGKIDAVVGGLEGLAASAFHETRTAPSIPPLDQPPTTQRSKPNRVQVDVRARGFGELLDFQERLSDMKGVASVSVNAIDSERATLTVELDATAEQARS